MTAGIARVLELHEPADDLDGVLCCECSHSWPCPTVAALVADEEACA